ncbi:hypothetical protein DID88_006064 [Monilinia fructigena]|uniref:Uncharacterized protein n=1 Tax=Monilinia fructigena TaxID=38457 RepID=A0A395IEM8_9HELO|nr:hypothetical protein DID88_006064 [Monilinia fructigena]
MLAADNIIDIIFGVASVFLTTVTICLMCKQHKSREIDMENGMDHVVKSIVPHPEPVSISTYQYMRSWPAELEQTAESHPFIQQPDTLPRIRTMFIPESLVCNVKPLFNTCTT